MSQCCNWYVRPYLQRGGHADTSQALYLEHLEQSLYTGGFNNFTDAEYEAAGFPPGFRENVGVIAEVCPIIVSPN